MPLLDVQSLDVHYGAIHALRGVSFRVEPGEIVTLIGANGAGKTTTLRAVSGLVKASGGSVSYEGASTAGVPAHALVARRMAHAPEGRGIFPQLTVRENLRLGAYLSTDPEAVEAGVQRAFGLFPRLKEREHQLAGTMSGGEQQMLAIGRALMSKPKLLLLDEPSLGLAPQVVAQIFRIIRDVNAGEGVSILLVEQNAHLALGMAHRGYVLETGTITLSGTGKELLASEDVRKAYLGE